MAASMRSTVLTAYPGSNMGFSETGLALISESGANVPTAPSAMTHHHGKDQRSGSQIRPINRYTAPRAAATDVSRVGRS